MTNEDIRIDVLVVDDGERRIHDSYDGPDARSAASADLVAEAKRCGIWDEEMAEAAEEGLDELLDALREHWDCFVDEVAVSDGAPHAVVTDYNDPAEGVTVDVFPSREAMHQGLRERLDEVGVPHGGVDDDMLADLFAEDFLKPTGGSIVLLELQAEPGAQPSLSTKGAIA